MCSISIGIDRMVWNSLEYLEVDNRNIKKLNFDKISCVDYRRKVDDNKWCLIIDYLYEVKIVFLFILYVRKFMLGKLKF